MTNDTNDSQQLQYQAACRYAALMATRREDWTTDDELFVQNYIAHMTWVTNGKGIL